MGYDANADKVNVGDDILATDLNDALDNIETAIDANESLYESAKAWAVGPGDPPVVGDEVETGLYAAKKYAADAAADLVSTNADVVLTNADVVLCDAAVVSASATAGADVWYAAPESYDIPDAVIGSDGHTYRCIGTSVVDDNPVGSVTGNWVNLTLPALSTPTGATVRGNINGLEPVRNSGVSLTLTQGSCMDSTGFTEMTHSAASTKDVSVAWASGGSLLTGSIAINTTYSIYLIYHETNGTVSWGTLRADLAIASYLPSGYTKYRWVGLIRTYYIAEMNPFTLNGDIYSFNNEIILATSFTGTSWTSFDYAALQVFPSGHVAEAYVRAYGVSNTDYLELSTLGTEGIQGATVLTANNSSNLWDSVSTTTFPLTPTSTLYLRTTNGYAVNLRCKRARVVR